jgi:CheY-like chemotaxis protein
MRPYGLTVDLASSGRESVDLVRSAKARYDAIFMDHMMPGMDGVEAVKAIRALDSEYARTVPVIALTANAIVGNEQMFLANGFQAYMSKPIDLGRLDEILDAWVRDPARELAESQIRGRGPAASPPAPQGPSPEGPAPQGPASDGPAPEGAGPERAGAAFDPSAAAAPADSGRGIEPYQPRPGKPPQPPVSEAVIQAAKELDSVDLAEGLKRFSGDRFAYFEVLRSYRDSAAELLARLRNPDSENLKDYTIAIHGLKSSSYGVCAKTIGRLAERLESKASEGDLEYVQANNPSFVAAVERVMESLGKFVDVVDQRRTLKPERQTPPPEPLERLRAACRAYDMDGVDAAIVEIDAYWYPSDPKLADWLKDRAEVMDFQGILDRFPGR